MTLRFRTMASHTLRAGMLSGCLLAGAWPAFAQAPPPAPPPEPPPGVEATAQFTFLDTRGNTETLSLGTAGDVTWRPGVWTHNGKAAFAENESDGVVDARSITALFRSSRSFNPRLSGYGQYDYLRDTYAGVDQRHVVEGGVSFKAVDSARQKLRLDGGLGYINEQGPGESLDSATLSTGGLYQIAISETAEFKYEPRYLLPLNETDSWKFEQIAALSVSINSVLALKASHTIRHSAAPPLGFESTDTIMAVSLVAKMSRR